MTPYIPPSAIPWEEKGNGQHDFPTPIPHTAARFARWDKIINFLIASFFLLQPLDRDEPTGRPQWRFTVFAQDDGGNGLVGYADVQVNLKDINDNAPLFPQGVYYGNVTENGTAGE